MLIHYYKPFLTVNEFHFRKQPKEMFYQECGVKNVSKFNGKRLSQSLLFNKFATFRSGNLIKKETLTLVFS